MVDPKTYEVGFDYASVPLNLPPPGDHLADEFYRISQALGSLRSAIMDVRRSDGALRNQIVTRESLSTYLRLGLRDARPWAVGTAYAEGDIVLNVSRLWLAVAAHTSSAATEPGVGAAWGDVWEVVILDGIVDPSGAVTKRQVVLALVDSGNPSGENVYPAVANFVDPLAVDDASAAWQAASPMTEGDALYSLIQTAAGWSGAQMTAFIALARSKPA